MIIGGSGGGADREGTGGLDSPGKSQVTQGSLRNTGTDLPLRSRVQLLLEGGLFGPL